MKPLRVRTRRYQARLETLHEVDSPQRAKRSHADTNLTSNNIDLERHHSIPTGSAKQGLDGGHVSTESKRDPSLKPLYGNNMTSGAGDKYQKIHDSNESENFVPGNTKTDNIGQQGLSSMSSKAFWQGPPSSNIHNQQSNNSSYIKVSSRSSNGPTSTLLPLMLENSNNVIGSSNNTVSQCRGKSSNLLSNNGAEQRSLSLPQINNNNSSQGPGPPNLVLSSLVNVQQQQQSFNSDVTNPTKSKNIGSSSSSVTHIAEKIWTQKSLNNRSSGKVFSFDSMNGETNTTSGSNKTLSTDASTGSLSSDGDASLNFSSSDLGPQSLSGSSKSLNLSSGTPGNPSESNLKVRGSKKNRASSQPGLLNQVNNTSQSAQILSDNNGTNNNNNRESNNIKLSVTGNSTKTQTSITTKNNPSRTRDRGSFRKHLNLMLSEGENVLNFASQLTSDIDQMLDKGPETSMEESGDSGEVQVLVSDSVSNVNQNFGNHNYIGGPGPSGVAGPIKSEIRIQSFNTVLNPASVTDNQYNNVPNGPVTNFNPSYPSEEKGDVGVRSLSNSNDQISRSNSKIPSGSGPNNSSNYGAISSNINGITGVTVASNLNPHRGVIGECSSSGALKKANVATAGSVSSKTSSATGSSTESNGPDAAFQKQLDLFQQQLLGKNTFSSAVDRNRLDGLNPVSPLVGSGNSPLWGSQSASDGTHSGSDLGTSPNQHKHNELANFGGVSSPFQHIGPSPTLSMIGNAPNRRASPSGPSPNNNFNKSGPTIKGPGYNGPMKGPGSSKIGVSNLAGSSPGQIATLGMVGMGLQHGLINQSHQQVNIQQQNSNFHAKFTTFFKIPFLRL